MSTPRTPDPATVASALPPEIDPVTGPVAVPVTSPTVTHYQQLAAEFSNDLDRIAAVIPRQEGHVSIAGFVRSHLNVPAEFVTAAVAAVEQTPELQAVNKLDPAAARDTLQFIEAFQPVLQKMTATVRNLRFTMNSRKAFLAAGSLQIYDLTKGLARDGVSPAMESLVANLKRSLNRGNRNKAAAARKTAAALPQSTTPAPVPRE